MKSSVKDLSLCALCAALLAVCAWISVPVTDIAFTMQTFGVFLTLGLLGGKRGTAAVLVYLLMGCVGLPVFSGFRGGIGVLLGATGGYILGFLAAALVYWAVTAVFPKGQLPAMILGMLACYGFGTAWFLLMYLGSAGTLGAVLAACVLPYVIPDAVKIALAYSLAKKMRRFVL